MRGKSETNHKGQNLCKQGLCNARTDRGSGEQRNKTKVTGKLTKRQEVADKR